jgi:O-antigen/teichoic acid export membrane protein
MATTPLEHAEPETHRGKRFVLNVFWNWLGVGATLFSGLLLSPYMIRKLGPGGYGVWALSFALVEYYWFLDLGFRSATVKFVAHHWAIHEHDKVSEVVSTALVYAGLIGLVIFSVVLAVARYLERFFQIPADYRDSFVYLVLLISLSWCVGIVFSLFGACLEAVQRFDYYNRVLVSVTALRAFGTAILLYLGYGLVAIGVMVVISQCFGYLLHFIFFRRVFIYQKISFRLATIPTLKRMGGYGIHNFLGNISTQLLNQAPPLLIGHFQPADYVGFFNLPVRLLQYTGEAVGRIGIITNASSAELAAKRETGALSQLAVYTNRYCVLLFMPLAMVFWTHGARFFQLWVPKAAAYSAPLLPILLTAYVIAVIGQFSSSMLLMGLARYQWYARGLMVEAVLSFAGLLYAIPRWGIIGAAWVSAILMVLNRGIFLPWLVSRVIGTRLLSFLNSIYTMPVIAGVPVICLSMWLKSTLLPGTNWFQLFAVGVIVATTYYVLAYFLCLPAEHRLLLRRWITNRLSTVKS